MPTEHPAKKARPKSALPPPCGQWDVTDGCNVKRSLALVTGRTDSHPGGRCGRHMGAYRGAETREVTCNGSLSASQLVVLLALGAPLDAACRSMRGSSRSID